MHTRGPSIVARTLSKPVPTGPGGALWQYHPRSDRHAKAACWAMILDLLENCPRLREDLRTGHTGFGVDHAMADATQGLRKQVDLVIGSPQRGRRPGPTLHELAERWRVELSQDDHAVLADLPALRETLVGRVRIGIMVKACMTEHVKALSRVQAELDATHQAIHGAEPTAIAVAYVVVNAAPTFLSPGRTDGAGRPTVTKHRGQPEVTSRVLARLQSLVGSESARAAGFDALAVSVIDLRNDGVTPVAVLADPPAPQETSPQCYDRMIRRAAALYEARCADDR